MTSDNLDSANQTNLTFISIEELLTEIFNRYEHCVFSGMILRTDKGDGNILTKRKYKGNSDTCIGLCVKLQNWIYKDWDETRKDFSEGNIEE